MVDIPYILIWLSVCVCCNMYLYVSVCVGIGGQAVAALHREYLLLFFVLGRKPFVFTRCLRLWFNWFGLLSIADIRDIHARCRCGVWWLDTINSINTWIIDWSYRHFGGLRHECSMLSFLVHEGNGHRMNQFRISGFVANTKLLFSDSWCWMLSPNPSDVVVVLSVAWPQFKRFVCCCDQRRWIVKGSTYIVYRIFRLTARTFRRCWMAVAFADAFVWGL